MKPPDEVPRDGGAAMDERTVSLGQKTADSQLMATANQFVDDLIERATEEASKRKAETERRQSGGDDSGGLASLLKRGGRWHSRARGVVNRLLTSLRLCK